MVVELRNVFLKQLKPTLKLRSQADKMVAELAVSIKNKGIICPLIVSEASADSYQVIDGVRRLKALKQNGARAKDLVPVLVVKKEEAQDIQTALVVNAVRQELDSWDLAETVNLLAQTYKYKATEIALALGKTVRYVDVLLSLFSLPQPILKSLRERRLTPAHGLRLLRIKDPSLREKAFRKVLEDSLSVRDLEVLVSSLIDAADGRISGFPSFKPTVYSTKAGSRLRFEPRRHSIRIEINLASANDMDVVVEQLKTQVKKLTKEKTMAPFSKT